MSTKRLYLVILVLVMGFQQASIAQEKPAVSSQTPPAKEDIDPQLKVNREALLKGSIDAATVMLFHENPKAREILLDVLKQSGNSPARMAVCNALIQARVSKKTINNDQDFIEPLLGVLATEVDAEAQLAAETTLVFKYERIGQSLEKIAEDASKPVKTRLNAIHALKLRPDMDATIKLIELVADPEKQVAAEAERALHSLGVSVGTDPEIRKQTINKLRDEDEDEFLRDWLIQQEEQMRKIRTDLDWWQKTYLVLLGKTYLSISDDAARGKFLIEYLGSPKAAVKLWALEEVYKWRQGTNPNLPRDELEPILIGLISDQDKNVRLKTATLLSLMRELNSAEHLLAQLESEPDDRVRTELLDALGGACSFALLPSAPVKIPLEIRKQALEWAAKYLSEEDVKKAQIGAEVMKKLLERDGLKPDEVDKYLGLLTERYNRQKSKPNEDLRGGLLSAMAGLCTQDSACKAKAAKLFEPLFTEAIRDEMAFVRETAVDGLAYIDKTNALKMLRKDFVNDPSIILRKKIITLADEAGSREDLYWLVEKIGSNSESKPAWQAMLKIFKDIFKNPDAGILNEWVERLTSQSAKSKLTNEQKIAFLEIAVVKATGENKQTIHKRLAELYYKTSQFERAADYLSMIYEAAQTSEAKKEILPDLLDVYLRGSKVEPAAKLIESCLSEADLDPNNAVLVSIDNYLSKPPAGADPNAVYKALTAITPPQPRPKWQQWLNTWSVRLGKAKEPEKPKQVSKKPE